jgi:hypothetical protein
MRDTLENEGATFSQVFLNKSNHAYRKSEEVRQLRLYMS